MTVISDQIAETPQAALAVQPEDAKCECTNCASESHGDDPSSPDLCREDAEYLVEYAGFSCADCLPMMVSMGNAMAEDQIDFGPSVPPNVRVAEYHAGAPIFESLT